MPHPAPHHEASPAPARRERLERALVGRRTPLSVAAALLLVALLASLRVAKVPEEFGGVPRPLHWLGKFDRPPGAGVILAGSSRVDQGIAPEVLAEELGVAAENFGFNSMVYDHRYLDALAARLPPRTEAAEDGARPTLVLAITPMSLAARSTDPNWFHNWSTFAQAPALRRLARGHTPLLARARQQYHRALGALSLRDAPRLLGLGRRAAGRRLVHQPTGWTAGDASPRDPAALLAVHERRLRSDPPDPATMESLLARVARWSGEEVLVVGLDMPAAADVRALEELHAGREMADFIARFESAGGRWIAAPSEEAGEFATYDGSHLAAADALRYSAWLAGRLRELGAGRTAPAGEPAPPLDPLR